MSLTSWRSIFALPTASSRTLTSTPREAAAHSASAISQAMSPFQYR
jgi:hypothetical protein